MILWLAFLEQPVSPLSWSSSNSTHFYCHTHLTPIPELLGTRWAVSPCGQEPGGPRSVPSEGWQSLSWLLHGVLMCQGPVQIIPRGGPFLLSLSHRLFFLISIVGVFFFVLFLKTDLEVSRKDIPITVLVVLLTCLISKHLGHRLFPVHSMSCWSVSSLQAGMMP